MKHVTRKHVLLSLLLSGIALCGVGFGTWHVVTRVNASADFSFGADTVLDVSKAIIVNDSRISKYFHPFEYNENGIVKDGKSSNEGDLIVPILISLNTKMSNDGIYNNSQIESGSPLNFTFAISEVKTNLLLRYCDGLSYYVNAVDNIKGIEHSTTEVSYTKDNGTIKANIAFSDSDLLSKTAIGVGLYYHLSFDSGYDFKTNVFDKREDIDFKVRAFLNV